MSPLFLPLAGCIGPPANPAATQPATAIDARHADGAYWYDQPAIVSVTSAQFEPLWRAAQEAVRDAGFKPDRLDYRAGVMTTRPLVSQQAFEPWRRDVASLHDLAQSTLATIRRTVRFEVAVRPDGSYVLAPKVLVERYSLQEHRVTSVVLYRDVFALTREEANRQREQQANLTQALTGPPPAEYWYAIGRDPNLEHRLADWIRDDVKSPGVYEH